jgi:hypothetical protein
MGRGCCCKKKGCCQCKPRPGEPPIEFSGVIIDSTTTDSGCQPRANGTYLFSAAKFPGSGSCIDWWGSSAYCVDFPGTTDLPIPLRSPPLPSCNFRWYGKAFCGPYVEHSGYYPNLSGGLYSYYWHREWIRWVNIWRLSCLSSTSTLSWTLKTSCYVEWIWRRSYYFDPIELPDDPFDPNTKAPTPWGSSFITNPEDLSGCGFYGSAGTSLYIGANCWKTIASWNRDWTGTQTDIEFCDDPKTPIELTTSGARGTVTYTPSALAYNRGTIVLNEPVPQPDETYTVELF